MESRTPAILRQLAWSPQRARSQAKQKASRHQALLLQRCIHFVQVKEQLLRLIQTNQPTTTTYHLPPHHFFASFKSVDTFQLKTILASTSNARLIPLHANRFHQRYLRCTNCLGCCCYGQVLSFLTALDRFILIIIGEFCRYLCVDHQFFRKY